MALIVANFSAFAKGSNEEKPISIIRDDETETFLKDISQKIFVAAGLNPDSIKIIIVNDPSINAYIAGGQNLFLHTGLITESDDVSGLMGVMAHESGHIKGAHLIQKDVNIKEANISSIAGYVIGIGSVLAGAPPEAGMALGSAGQNIATRKFLAYSREYENAADTVALDVLKKIDVTPNGLVTILRKLLAKQKISGDITDEYMLTHPVSEERINRVLNFIKANPELDKAPPADLERRFKMVKAKVMGFLLDPERTKNFYLGKTTPDAIYARAIALNKEAKFDESVALINQLISQDPKNPYFTELKAQFSFERGKIDESIKEYREVLKMVGNSGLIRLKLAEGLLATNNQTNWQEAVGQLKAVLAIEPKNISAINRLGIAYGKLGKLGQSYLYLSESAIIAKDKPSAKRYIMLAENNIDKKSSEATRLAQLKKDLEGMLAEK